MSEPISVTHERVDDIPLLLAQLNRMGVQGLLERHFHSSWQLARSFLGMGSHYLALGTPSLGLTID